MRIQTAREHITKINMLRYVTCLRYMGHSLHRRYVFYHEEGSAHDSNNRGEK